MKKFYFLEICGLICSHSAIASNFFDVVHPFVGGNIGLSVNDQDENVVEKYGVPYSTFSANNPNFVYGINTGIRFLNDSYIYHPGVQMFYNQIIGTTNLNVANAYYGSDDYSQDASHNLFGGEFDNYIRVVNNEKSLFSDKWNGFVVFGFDIGKIKSKYEFMGYDIKDDGNFYGAKIEYLAENNSGFGFTIGMKLLKTTTEALPTILISNFGLRQTF